MKISDLKLDGKTLFGGGLLLAGYLMTSFGLEPCGVALNDWGKMILGGSAIGIGGLFLKASPPEGVK